MLSSVEDDPFGENAAYGGLAVMRYKADITAGALKVPESRVVAGLLLRGINGHDWDEAICGQNVLQVRNPATAKRLTRLIRGRLELMAADLWGLVRDGSATLGYDARPNGYVEVM